MQVDFVLVREWKASFWVMRVQSSAQPDRVDEWAEAEEAGYDSSWLRGVLCVHLVTFPRTFVAAGKFPRRE